MKYGFLSNASAYEIASVLITELQREAMDGALEDFIKAVFVEKPSEKQISERIIQASFDSKNKRRILLLANLKEMLPSVVLPPNLESLLKQESLSQVVGNARLKGHYAKIVSAFKREGIDVMVIKGGAMKCYRPTLPRIMGDIDVLVREHDFERAIEIAFGLGYYGPRTDHSVDLHVPNSPEGVLDIHKHINVYNKASPRTLNETFFRRAKKESVFGIEGYLPSNEDMVFILLVNLAKNFWEHQGIANLPTLFFDIEYLLRKKDFDWSIVLENVRINASEMQFFLAVEFVRNLAPTLIPKEIVVPIEDEKAFQDFCTMTAYRNLFLNRYKMRNRTLTTEKVSEHAKMFIGNLGFKIFYGILRLPLVFKSARLSRFILSFDK